ncbi:MAG: FKBP-type peptidyl-prolyl cis-trans isomerase [Bacteroidales bacterium]|nr:FKBP-type peptidyl-prolyl cis-trans isomerase [Bacteroidales bacterium]
MNTSKANLAGWALFILLFVVTTTISSCKKDEGVDQGAIDRELIDQYVAEKQLDGRFTESGLFYVVVKEGNGEYPSATSLVTVSYKGYLLNGDVFDEGEYLTALLTNLITGWQEGIQLIDAGGKIKLVIPSHLAYGSQSTESIPPNSVLVFDITLHAFQK